MTSTSSQKVEPVVRLALVVARARNGVIGRDGDLPWRLKADLAHFKRVTLGKPVLMGRKTWESLPFALPGRANLVLTRDPDYVAQKERGSGRVFTDFDAMLAEARAIAAADGVDEVCVIGGEALYRLALERADRLYLTEVDVDVEGDARFPQLDDGDWGQSAQTRHEADITNDHAFTIRTLERVGA